MKVFVEEQKFKRWILLAVMVVPIVTGIIPIILQENDIPNFESDGFWGLMITGFIIVAVFIFILSIKLTTKINEQGIYYQYFPNHFSEKFIAWNDVSECYLKEMKFFGIRKGYGYRRCFFGKNKGVVMNLGGKFGLQLELKNGKKINIGTQRKEEVIRVLETYNYKLKKDEER